MLNITFALCNVTFAQDSTRVLDAAQKYKYLEFKLIDTIQGQNLSNFEKKSLPLPLAFGSLFNLKKSLDFSKPKKNIDIKSGGIVTYDSDVLVKRYFNGKDTSNDVKMSSDFNLGTLYSSSNSVRIEVRDHSLVDGDRIKVFLNEKLLNSNIKLEGLNTIIFINLKQGYNRIDIQALNEGYSGPNTAEIKVYDEGGSLLASKNWNIRTGERATLGVVKN
ncbi:hypothetical protein MWU59_05740 [Flavobacteriaceae bacterium F08102]|nr:hypothetical protein [Flavobacteriaceae bacterium F08102]